MSKMQVSVGNGCGVVDAVVADDALLGCGEVVVGWLLELGVVVKLDNKVP